MKFEKLLKQLYLKWKILDYLYDNKEEYKEKLAKECEFCYGDIGQKIDHLILVGLVKVKRVPIKDIGRPRDYVSLTKLGIIIMDLAYSIKIEYDKFLEESE